MSAVPALFYDIMRENHVRNINPLIQEEAQPRYELKLSGLQM